MQPIMQDGEQKTSRNGEREDWMSDVVVSFFAWSGVAAWSWALWRATR